MKKVLVLGGGFAGLDAAIHLKKRNFDVTLVSEREYFYIYPISIWIPTSQLSFKDACIDLKELQRVHKFHLIIDEVVQISKKESFVRLKKEGVYEDYDYLVVAFGASKMKHKGLENTLSICAKPEQSIALQEKLNSIITNGSGTIAMGFGGNPKDFSAVRGGPAFELIFNVDTLLRKKGIRENFKLIFFAPMEKPGKKMGEKALSMMDASFKRLNIETRFGTKISRFTQEGIEFEDESKLTSDVTMFIPAGSGHDLLQESDLLLNEAGFIKTDDYSCVLNNDNSFSNIYAIGDAVALEGYEWRAKQGHLAEVMAKNAAHNIEQRERGGHNFKGYKEHLSILCVMDNGDGAILVYRDNKRSFLIPMPYVGHLLKKAWGSYCRYTKLGKMPRLPFM